MSLEALRWALYDLPVEVKPVERMVLLYLADRARADHAEGDGTQQAWPSRQSIADAAGVSLSTVRRAIAQLNAAGLIEPGQQHLSRWRQGSMRPKTWRLRTDRRAPDPGVEPTRLTGHR